MNEPSPAGSWSFKMTVDLTTRTDTGKINQSPVTSIASSFKLGYNCYPVEQIYIPGRYSWMFYHCFIFSTLLHRATCRVPIVTLLLFFKIICIKLWHIMFVCLFVVIRPTPEFFSHMETSSLQLKG